MTSAYMQVLISTKKKGLCHVKAKQLLLKKYRNTALNIKKYGSFEQKLAKRVHTRLQRAAPIIRSCVCSKGNPGKKSDPHSHIHKKGTQ